MAFYEQLNVAQARLSKRNIAINRDLNAKVASDIIFLRHVMEKTSVGERDNSDERFVDFCSLHHFDIGGRPFKQKNSVGFHLIGNVLLIK